MPSEPQRLTNLELGQAIQGEQIKGLRDDVTEIKADVSHAHRRIDQQVENRRERDKERRSNVVLVILAIIGAAGTIVAAIFANGGHP